jgi:hypothetical protein
LTRSPARFGISDGATTTHFVPARRQVTLDAIAARPRFVTNPKPDALAAELAPQAIQRRWRVGNPTIFPDLTA